MNALRRSLLHHRRLAIALVMLALLMRVAVPAGTMPVFANGGVGIALCSGHGPMQGAADHGSGNHDRADAPCAFAGLAMPALAGADPILLALAIAFVAVRAVRTATPIPATRRPRLRPPLRGPPAQA